MFWKELQLVGQPIYETLHGVKKGIKDIVAPQGMFEDLGLKYFGPVDGHNIEALESAFIHAKNFNAPVLVHVITEKVGVMLLRSMMWQRSFML